MAVVCSWSVVACSAQQDSSSTEPVESDAKPLQFSWDMQSGKTIHFLTYKHPWSDAIQASLGEFTELTGIKVEMEVVPEQQARQKLAVEMAAGGVAVDVFFTSLHVEKKLYSAANWYQDLKAYMDNPLLTSPDYDYEDFFEGARNGAATDQGTITAMPLNISPFIFYYRKDLFEQAGLTPPTTLQQVREYAELLHNPPEVYGFVNRGLRNANVTTWSFALRSMGGSYFEQDGVTPALNTPAAIRATEWYAGLLRDYGPPGAINFNWNESISIFGQGKAAMSYDSSDLVVQLEDPDKSKVVGRVGYMLVPPDEETGISDHNNGLNALAISNGSKNKEAAWLFIQWATGKEMTLKAQLAGVYLSRASAYQNEQFVQTNKMPKEYVETTQEALRLSEPNLLPDVKNVSEYRDIVGLEVQTVVGGMEVTSAMERAQKNILSFMRKDSQ